MGEKSNNKRAVFLSDSPLESVKDDLLGWGRLADNIVETIKLNIREKGFVIGIKGKWGTGKSTLLNFLEEKLNKENEYIIFRYNPWLYPNENHVENFFAELSKALNFERSDKKNERLILAFRKYGAFSSLAQIPARFILRVVSVATFSLLALAGVSGALVRSKWWYVGLSVVALFVILIGFSKKFLAALENFYSSKHDLEKFTLYQLKQELSKQMSDTKIRVVVLVDDIDRLSPSEICNIFQLVKNNGDIENITYVLAFDDDVVKEVLAKEYSDQYQFFTEKMIQIAFTVPNPEAVKLSHFFTEQLDAALSKFPESLGEYWDQGRWGILYFTFIRRTLSNFRDVKRILNGIHLNLPLIFNENTIEVDPIDFIAIETIRVKFHPVYDFIRNHKHYLVHIKRGVDTFPLFDIERGEAFKQYQDFINTLDQQDSKMVDALLRDMFPKIQSLEKGNEAAYENEEWERELRICTEKTFDRYFIYGNYEGDISNRELSQIVTNIGRRDYVMDFVSQYKGNAKLTQIVEGVSIKAGDVVEGGKPVNDFVTFFFDVSDLLPAENDGMLDISPLEVLRNSITRVLANLQPDFRANVLHSSIPESRSLLGPFLAVHMVEEMKEPQEYIGSEKVLSTLKRAAVNKGMPWLEHSDSLEHPWFRFILGRIHTWGDSHRVRDALARLTKEPQNLKIFVSKFLKVTKIFSSFQGGPTYEYEYDFEGLKQYFAFRTVCERLNKVPLVDSDSDLVKKAWELFIAGVHEHWEEK